MMQRSVFALLTAGTAITTTPNNSAARASEKPASFPDELWVPPAWRNRLNQSRATAAAARVQQPRVPLRAVQHQLQRLLCALRLRRHCTSASDESERSLVTTDGACSGENCTIAVEEPSPFPESDHHSRWALTLLLMEGKCVSAVSRVRGVLAVEFL